MPAAAVPSCSMKPGCAASANGCAGPRSSRTAAASAAKKGTAMIARRTPGREKRATAEIIARGPRPGASASYLAPPGRDPGVVLAQIPLVRLIGRIRLAGGVRIFANRMEGQRAHRRAERGVQVGVFDPAVGVQQKVPGPPGRKLRGGGGIELERRLVAGR